MSRYKRSTVRYTLDPGAHVDAWHRFSRDHQDDASALAAIERYCAERQLVIDRTWGRPATSGSTITSTHEWHDFIAAMEDRPESDRRQRGIVVWKASRLGRDQVETDYYTAHLRRLGYAVIAIADPLTGSDLDPVLESFIRWKDQKLLEDISTDIKRTMQWLREAGYSTGGRPPRGFIAVREENAQRPRRHSGEKRVNARWVRGGEHEQATAEAWQLKVSGATDRAIHRQTHLFKAEHCYHDMWLRHAYVDASYVTEDEWQRLQALMQSRMVVTTDTSRHPRRSQSGYLLSGLLYCSCGAAMNGVSMPRNGIGEGPRTWTPGPDAYVYYRCGAVQRGQPCTDSEQGLLPAPPVEEAVIAAVLDHILTPDHLAELRAQMAESLQATQAELSARLASLREQHQHAEAAITRLTDAIEQGGQPGPLVAKLNERTQERDELAGAIRQVAVECAACDPEILSDEQWAEMGEWMERGVRGTRDVHEQRLALRALIQRIDILPGRAGLVLTYRFGGGGPMSKVSPPVGTPSHRHIPAFTLTIPCPRARPHAHKQHE